MTKRPRPRKRINPTVLWSLAACLCAAKGVQAQQVQQAPGSATGQAGPGAAPAGNQATLGISEGFAETDNIFETSSGQRSQTQEVTGLDFGLQRTGAIFNVNTNGNFQYVDYLQGAYSPQLFGRADGEASMTLIPDRLKWTLQDSYGDQQINPLVPTIPGNLERVNVVSTGPDVVLASLYDTTVQVGGRYARTTYQDSPFDGYQILETFSANHKLSPGSEIDLVADVEQMRFDDTTQNTDFDQFQSYLQYVINGARTRILVQAGEAQSNEAGDWYRSAIGELKLDRKLSSMTSFSLEASRQLTNAASSFSSLTAGAATQSVVAPVPVTTGSYVADTFSGTLNINGRRTTFSVSLRAEHDSYVVDDVANVSREDLEVSLQRRLTPMLTARILGSVQQSRYTGEGFRETDYMGGFDLSWRMSRTLSLLFGYQHNSRGTEAGGYGYDSNNTYLRILWQPFTTESVDSDVTNPDP